MSTIKPYLRLSGLEPLVIRPETNFVNVGERTNVTAVKNLQALSVQQNLKSQFVTSNKIKLWQKENHH
jgi:5-methyltetrahydrofolate--homocysteine methyltransferase